VGEDLVIHKHGIAMTRVSTQCQGERFCCGSALIQHGGVSDIQAGEIADHRLVVQQRLQPAL